MELTKIQLIAAEEIISHYSAIDKKKVDFKAPTGSGKTLIASYIISSLIERNINDKLIFIVATPSSSSLPYFFEKKINQYKKDLPYSKFDVEYIESPSSSKKDSVEQTPRILCEQSKVYIFGKSTFGAKRIFTELNVIDDFIDDAHNRGFKIIYIRDEAHIGDLNSDKETRRFENLMQDSAHFVIKMTATPNYNDSTTNIVLIKESDLNDGYKNDNKWLLKTKPITLLEQSVSEDELLERAILKYKDIKNEYTILEKDGIFIHPALLIQVSNEPTNKHEKSVFNEYLSSLKDRLNYHNLAWVQYFGNSNKDSNRVFKDNFSLDDVTESKSNIDVIIFKVGPSTGWDIPRACMLLQLRKVCSESLNIQTIGRIKRNPFPNLLKNEITDKYYIYSNAPQKEDSFIFYTFSVKNSLNKEDFLSLEIANKSKFRISSNNSIMSKDLNDFIITNKIFLMQDIRNLFVRVNNVDIFKNELYSVGGAVVYNSISNPFIFLKIYKRLVESKNHFYKLCEKSILDCYNSSFINEKIYDTLTVKKEHLIYILLHKYTKQLNDIIRKNSPFTPTYKVIANVYEPSKFVEIYDSLTNEVLIDPADKSYLFDISKNNTTPNQQPIDSIAEKTVFDFLKQDIYGINQYLNNKVKAWCKNYTSSNVSGEYLDENHSFRKSFFDFIIKFSNGAYLYIEVKSKDDIDIDKTKLLKKAYNEFFSSKHGNLFNTPIVISVWTVDGPQTYCENFYDKAIFKNTLDDCTTRNLLSTIALLSF